MSQRLRAIEDGINQSNFGNRSLRSPSDYPSEKCPPHYQDLHTETTDSFSIVSQGTEVANDRDRQNNGAQQSSSIEDSSHCIPNYGSVIHVTSQTVVEYEEIPVTANKATFAEDLKQSRVYQRNEAGPRNSVFSVSSSIAGTGHWSMLSGLSMAEVSNISVINLPIIYQDVHELFRTDIAANEHPYSSESLGAISPPKCSACKLSYAVSPSAGEKSIFTIGKSYADVYRRTCDR